MLLFLAKNQSIYLRLVYFICLASTARKSAEDMYWCEHMCLVDAFAVDVVQIIFNVIGKDRKPMSDSRIDYQLC